MVSKFIIKIKKAPNYAQPYIRFCFKLDKLHHISAREFEGLRKLSIIRRSNIGIEIDLKELFQFTPECYINLEKISDANMQNLLIVF